MNKNYFLAFLILFFVVTGTQAQTCTPDPQYATNDGIWPDTTTNFNGGVVGVAYNQNITVTVPQDTTIGSPPFTTTIPFDSVHMVSMSNLPPGLTYMCSPSICTWLGGTSGCAAIYGTPTTAGTYSLSIVVNAYVGGSTTPIVENVNGYKIIISAGVGISENSSLLFEVKQNMPNPFSGKTTIVFSSPSEEKVKISVYNMLGKIVIEKKIEAVKGENEVEIDGKNLTGGMYFYTVEYKGKTVTRRMMVNNL